MTLVFVAVVVSAAMAVIGPAVAAAQNTEGSISGTVTEGGDPVDGVSVDLFRSDQAGNRLEWLRSTTTGDDGGYRFDVDPGCSSVTFIAPTDRLFTNGSRWQNVSVCLDQGDSQTTLSAELAAGDAGALVGTVVNESGGPIDGVSIDLYSAGPDGARGNYLTSTTTGVSGPPGSFRFDAGSGCYVLTYIAGGNRTWETTGSEWFNTGSCVADGQETNLDPVALIGEAGTSAVLDIAVTSGGETVGGVGVDVFLANADGTRGGFIDSFTTDADQRTSFELRAAQGCNVLTLIAPINTTFSDNGSKWLNRSFCIVAGQTTYTFDEVLSNSNGTCAANSEFELVVRDDFDGTVLADHWSAYNSTGNAGYGLRRPSAVTVDEGMLVITAAMENGTLVSGGISHGFAQTYGRYRFRVRTDNDPSQAMSGVVLTWPRSGVHPRDGENNIYSTLARTQERNPFYSFIHKPFGSVADLTPFVHNADGSRFQIMTMEWTPDHISITREGPGGVQQTETFVLAETSGDLIPDVSHGLAIQLDAWKPSIGQPVQMEVDWVEVSKYCG